MSRDDGINSFLVDGEDIFGAQDDDHDYHNKDTGSDQGDVEDIEEDASSAAMPPEFYANLDSFLGRPAPKVHQFADASSSQPVLPRHVSPLQRKQNKVKLPNISKSNNDGMVRSRSLPNTSKSSGYGSKKPAARNLDPSLVSEAFNYVEKLSRVNEELSNMENALQQREEGVQQSRSAPQTAIMPTDRRPPKGKNIQKNNKNKSGRGNKSKSSSSLVGKLRSATREHSEKSFDTSISDGAETKNVFDMAALVENFEKGIALQELRAALSESQASVEKSQTYIRNITMEFSSSRR